MKLYIPTSSLNFNNILSTESISPEIFYAERGFGYSRWFAVEENNIPNVVLLYEEPHTFARPHSDMEDHPMLVEYTTDEEYPVCGDGVRYSDRTIYLDPWNARFLFFSQNDMQVALSLSESSLETKLLRLYKKHIDCVKPKSLRGKFTMINAKSVDVPFNVGQMELDRQINKMKGFLYGYYIGAYLSMRPETLCKTNVLREISNIFSSVMSAMDRTPSKAQKERLSELFDTLQEQEPAFLEILNELGDKAKTARVIAILRKYNINLSRFDWRALVASMKKANDGECKAISWINQEMDKQDLKAIAERKTLPVNSAEVLVSQGKLVEVSNEVVGNCQLLSLLKSWVNDVLCSNEFNGKVSAEKEVLSDTLTSKAKDVLGDDWAESHVRTFMNQLRRHIRGEEFNQPWDNGVLSAMASCLIKGDDWEQLLLFMQSRGITDYRLAFSIYGMLNGFANLTRDFTDQLLNLHRMYVAEVYKEFARQLLNASIVADNQMSEAPQPEVSQERKTISPSEEKQAHLGNVLDTTANIMRFFDSPSFGYKGSKKAFKKLRDGLLDAIKSFGDDNNAYNFLKVLNEGYESYGWGKKKKPWNILKERYAPDYDSKTSGRGRDNSCSGLQTDLMSEFSKQDMKVDDNARNTFSNPNSLVHDGTRRPVKEGKNVVYSNEPLKFHLDNVKIIISRLSEKLGFDSYTAHLLGNDLSYILDPKRVGEKNIVELLDIFVRKINEGKTQTRTRFGNDISWKNEPYKKLNVDEIKKIIMDMCN